MKKLIAHLYLATWCLYYLQGTLYKSGSVISQGLMLILLFASLYYYVYANLKYKLPQALKALNVLVVLFTIYGTIIILFGNGVSDVANYFYLKNIYMALLPVYPFYVFSKKKQLTEKAIRCWVFIFIPIAIASFFRQQREMVIAALEVGSTREDFTNNAGYILLSIIPSLVFWQRKPVVQYLLIAICVVFIMMAVKRGAILIGALSILCIVVNSFKHQPFKSKIVVFILAMALLGATYYFFIQMMESSDLLLQRIEQTMEGDSSDRDVLYTSFIEHILYKTNMYTLLFGSGADATLRMLGAYAHNDWLEIAVNNGILGVLLYFYYWCQMLKTYRKTRNNTMKMIIGLYVLVFFLKSLVSMSYNSIPIYATVALGYALAQEESIQNIAMPASM